MNDDKRKDPPHLHILKLTFAFFAAGMMMFLVAMIAAIWLIPDFVQLQSLRNPKGWFLAHLFLLGWATMVAMGASFQITQVMMRTSLYSRTLGYIQFVFYILGFFAVISGFFTDTRLIVLGGGCIALGGLLYVFNLVMTFVRKKEWNLFVFGVCLSLIEFLLTIFLGIAMGLGFAYGWNADHYAAIFGSHLWFGIAGWLSGLIIVYSFKLLPMFYISRKKLTPSSYWIIGSYHFGVWLQALSLWSDAKWIAAVATFSMIVSLGWFIIHLFEVRKQSSGKQPIGAVKVAFFLIPASSFLFLLWSGLNWFGGISNLDEVLIFSLILGWFSPTILSYLSKILPFLWWAHRYRTKEDKKSAVLLSEMLPENRMTRELVGYLTGIAAVIFGFLFKLPMVAVLGQIAAFGFVVIYILELLRLFRY